MKSALRRKIVAAAVVLIAILGGLCWQQSKSLVRYFRYGTHAKPNWEPWPEGTNGMVAATTGGAATQAGLKILKEGGTAADAAMATALTEVVQAGGANVSFGGIMMMVYYEASTGRVYFLDAQYNTPLAETNPLSIPATGGRTALVPGFMAGVQAVHDKFGKVSFQRLFAPAIALAEKGEPVTSGISWWINSKKDVLSRFPETKRIFTKANGKFYRQGDLFPQLALAQTLRKVAAQGASYMYEGEWGRKFVEVIQRNGGKITQQDMTNYHASWEEPLQTTYRDYRVFAAGLQTYGGVMAVEGFNLLELANLKQYGHYTKSPRSLYWFMQIVDCARLAFDWRDVREHDLSPASRATKQTSAWIWEKMQNGVLPWREKAMKNASQSSAHTDGIVVVDRWGNIAVVNHTSNTVGGGNTGIYVDGVSIPDSATFQPRLIAQAGPGHRLPNAMCPLIIMRDAKPMLGSAAVGVGYPKTLQVIVNILDFDMNPQTAVDTPSFLWNTWSSPLTGQVETNMFDSDVLDGVRSMGIKVRVLSRDKASPGYWVGVQVDQKTHRLTGAVSQGLEGQVETY
jgi:gamma-glutamyltranspeptidase/glutathione hydrolase